MVLDLSDQVASLPLGLHHHRLATVGRRLLRPLRRRTGPKIVVGHFRNTEQETVRNFEQKRFKIFLLFQATVVAFLAAAYSWWKKINAGI